MTFKKVMFHLIVNKTSSYVLKINRKESSERTFGRCPKDDGEQEGLKAATMMMMTMVMTGMMMLTMSDDDDDEDDEDGDDDNNDEIIICHESDSFNTVPSI